MSWIFKYVNSSIGKKQLMAVTGGCLLGFLLVHFVGNCTLLIPAKAARADAFNKVAETYASLKFLLYVAEAGLVVLFGVHIVNALRTWRENRAARAAGYEVQTRVGDKSLPSFVMIYTGTFLLAWLVLHILTFKFGKGVFADIIPHDGQITLYDVVSFWFSQSWYAAIYVIAMLCLGFHLWHGVGSVFQTLGLRHPKYTPIIEFCGKCYAALIGGGNALIVVTCFLREACK